MPRPLPLLILLAACSVGGGDAKLLRENAVAIDRIDKGDLDGALAAWDALAALLPADLDIAAAGFHIEATRLERAGTIAPGAADQWVYEMAGLIDDREGFTRLVRRVRRAGCEPCAIRLERTAAHLFK